MNPLEEVNKLAELLNELARAYNAEHTPWSVILPWENLNPCTRDRYRVVASNILELYTRKEMPCPTPNSNA